MSSANAKTVAELVVDFLVARGVDRVFGLQGGHIQPIWDQLAQRGVRIVDVRDEGAAVHMAHAHAVLTGSVGVAMVTAGPGVTNCVTAMANAQLERVPVLLIGGCAPGAQDDLGPLQGIAARRHHAARHARCRARCASPTTCCAISTRRMATAAGRRRPAGSRVRRDSRPTCCGRRFRRKVVLRRVSRAEAATAYPARSRRRAASGARMIGEAPASAGAHRPRRADAPARARALPRPHRRGLSRHAGKPRPGPGEHASVVGAMRGRAMQEADLRRRRRPQARLPDWATARRRSFRKARFMRIADNWEELRENRRGEVELFATPALALDGARQRDQRSGAKLDTAVDEGAARRAPAPLGASTPRSLAESPAGKDGHMHPNRIFAALQRGPEARRDHHRRRRRHPELRADGTAGPHLPRFRRPSAASASASRTASPPPCVHPDRQVVVVTGDGAFGINAMEIDSAKRHGAKVGVHRRQQRRLEHRAPRPGDELRRPRRRHDAAMVRLCGDGARVRPARRARDRSGAAACGARGGVRQSAGADRRRGDAATRCRRTRARGWAGCPTTRR